MSRLLIKSLFLAFSLVTFVSCNKDEPSFTGNLNLTFNNVSLFNQDDLFVGAEILVDKNDIEPLIELGKKNINKGSSATFTVDNLNFGNYYVRYTLFLKDDIVGEKNFKPIQINAGKTATVKIDL